MPQSGYIYALRRTMPLWSFEDNLAELDELVEEGVQEVIVKVDVEEFSHGQIPLAYAQKYQEKLFRLREKLSTLGLRYSLNPWITVGHADRGRRAAEILPGVQTLVDISGKEAIGCACPLSVVWQEHTKAVWTLYAETNPYVIWIEDDIRSMGHGAANSLCFCSLHLKRFWKIIGKEVTREEVASAILQQETPHPWRKLYLDMQSDIMIDTVKMLAKTIHAKSPDTCIGLMSSGGRNHTQEGRRWQEFAHAVADGKQLFSRPPTATYQEFSIRDNYYASDSFLLTRSLMPQDTIEQTEIDNWNFTRYAKSVTFTGLELETSAAFGAPGSNLNLYDHEGTLMKEEPTMGKLLKDKKPRLDALATIHTGAKRFRGVQLLFSPDYGRLVHLPPNATFSDLAEPGCQFMYHLNMHGFPVVYTDEPCRVAVGQSIRGYSDDALQRMLGKGQGIFLDAEAVMVLLDRGLGDFIGVRSAQPLKSLAECGVFSAEEFYNTTYGGAPRKFMNCLLTYTDGFPISKMEFFEQCQEVTRLVGPDLNVLSPGIMFFENALGGRIVISTQSLLPPSALFCNTHRQQLLDAIFKFLTFDNLPVTLVGDGVYPQLFRCDSKSATTVGFFNLSQDDWTNEKFILKLQGGEKLFDPKILTQDGTWLPIEMTQTDDTVSLNLNEIVRPCHGAIIAFTRIIK